MALISANDAAECYEKASRMGKKEGEPIAVLDDILKEKNISRKSRWGWFRSQ